MKRRALTTNTVDLGFVELTQTTSATDPINYGDIVLVGAVHGAFDA